MDTTTAPIDTSVMPTIHTFFRREVRLAGGVIRRVADGDVRRATVVADHLDFVARTLHEHHTAEDELLWPKLLDRVPEELAPIVRLMEAQHGQVDALLAEIGDLRPRWAATAEPADRDRLADLFDQLYVHLAEHLDAEEERLLPIAARAVTQAEWEEMGERGRTQHAQVGAVPGPGHVPVRGGPRRHRADAGRGARAGALDRAAAVPPRLPPARAGHPRDRDALTGRVPVSPGSRASSSSVRAVHGSSPSLRCSSRAARACARAAAGSPSASANRASVCSTEPRKNADRPPAANRSA